MIEIRRMETKPIACGIKKRTRTRKGCLNCRRRRKKCDEAKPSCTRCVNARENCKWSQLISFRPENALSAEHVHKARDSGVDLQGPERIFQILDITAEVSREYPNAPGDYGELLYQSPHGSTNSIASSSKLRQGPMDTILVSEDEHDITNNVTASINGLSHTKTATVSPGRHQVNMTVSDLLLQNHGSTPRPAYTSPTSPENPAIPIMNAANKNSLPGVNAHRYPPSYGREEEINLLLSLSNEQPGMSSHTILSGSEILDTVHDQAIEEGSIYGYSPEFITDDGIFLPGSTYRELHQTLRSHVFHIARSKPASCHQSPKLAPLDSATSITEPGLLLDAADNVHTPPELTQEQESILWSNWITEISGWLDKFDRDKHFRHSLPVMAKTNPHLRFSMLALSARQLERKEASLPVSLSLALYQEAIHLLLPSLHTRDVAALASCVVLCVLEMFSCSPKAWRRHLDGCASLIQSMNIRGDSGGVEQALFWCFARMDVCGGLICSERTLVPVEFWTSRSTFDDDIAMFSNSPVFEDQANLMCYLMARVLDLFSCSGLTLCNAGVLGSRSLSETPYADNWCALFDCIERWHDQRSEEMKAVLSLKSDHTSVSNPFPMVLYSNGAAISGNQLYHTAMVLMLQKKPAGIVRKSRSILWHARQICAISISNSHHGCWTNCIQPLWIAGQVMSHPSEHRAIIDVYDRIERETGWGAAWRVEDLKEHWGDLYD